MSEHNIPTAETVVLYDASLFPPPANALKLLVHSVYGVTSVGQFDPNFHVAWGYMPKVPDSVKARLKGSNE